MSSYTTTLVASLALFSLANLTNLNSVQGEDKLKDLIRSTGYIEVKLVEAHVPDLDLLPGQGDSDVFVRLYLNDTKELICESQIVQDENKPKVSKIVIFIIT